MRVVQEWCAQWDIESIEVRSILQENRRGETGESLTFEGRDWDLTRVLERHCHEEGFDYTQVRGKSLSIKIDDWGFVLRKLIGVYVLTRSIVATALPEKIKATEQLLVSRLGGEASELFYLLVEDLKSADQQQ